MKFKIYLLLIASIVIACKEDPLPEPDNAEGKKGLLILNEGLFQQNNAAVSYLNTEGVLLNDYFLNQNGRLLGDTGNDMVVHGGKIYIVVHASSTIEVLDKSTLKVVKQIKLQYQGQNQMPRFALGMNDKLYVSSYDGYVNVIDTSSLSVTNRIEVGNNPEGIAISNNKLYVANSGGLNSPIYDSTLSVIDLLTLTVENEIFVGANPGEVISDAQGDIYVVKRGDYNNDPSRLLKVDTQNNNQVVDLGVAANTLFLDENQKLWIASFNYGTEESNVAVLDAATESIISQNFINASDIESLYGVFVDGDKLYCLDARGFTLTGKLKIYNADTGVFIEEKELGLNPNTIVKL